MFGYVLFLRSILFYLHPTEVFNFTQDDLLTEDIMVLDTRTKVFIWIGQHANSKLKQQSFDIGQVRVCFDSLEVNSVLKVMNSYLKNGKLKLVSNVVNKRAILGYEIHRVKPTSYPAPSAPFHEWMCSRKVEHAHPCGII